MAVIAGSLLLNRPSILYLVFEGEIFHEFHESITVRENFASEMFIKKNLSLSALDNSRQFVPLIRLE